MAKIKHFQNNEVRITGGAFRSRIIRFNTSEGLRPSADMVREKLFNWLGQDLKNRKVLDAFSGSGVLAFESVSRGASLVDGVEKNSQVALKIQENITLLQVTNMRLYQEDALRFLATTIEKYHIVYLDPPFVWKDWGSLWPLLYSRLEDSAFVYIEAGSMPILPDYLQVYKSGKSGKSQFCLAQLNLVV